MHTLGIAAKIEQTKSYLLRVESQGDKRKRRK